MIRQVNEFLIPSEQIEFFEFKKECIWYLESEDSILMKFERFETEANLLPEGFHNFDDYSNWHCRYVLGSS